MKKITAMHTATNPAVSVTYVSVLTGADPCTQILSEKIPQPHTENYTARANIIPTH